MYFLLLYYIFIFFQLQTGDEVEGDVSETQKSVTSGTFKCHLRVLWQLRKTFEFARTRKSRTGLHAREIFTHVTVLLQYQGKQSCFQEEKHGVNIAQLFRAKGTCGNRFLLFAFRQTLSYCKYIFYCHKETLIIESVFTI